MHTQGKKLTTLGRGKIQPMKKAKNSSSHAVEKQITPKYSLRTPSLHLTA
jgi:hypothetical protein